MDRGGILGTVLACVAGVGGCGSQEVCAPELTRDEFARELVSLTLPYLDPAAPGDGEAAEEDPFDCQLEDLSSEGRARVNEQLAAATLRPHGGEVARDALRTGEVLDRAVLIAHPSNEDAIVDYLQTSSELADAPRLVLARWGYPLRVREFAEELATLIEWSFWGEYTSKVVARRAHFMGVFQEQCLANAIRGYLRTFVEESSLPETTIVLDRRVIEGQTWQLDELPDWFRSITSPDWANVDRQHVARMDFDYELLDTRTVEDGDATVHQVDFTLTGSGAAKTVRALVIP
jgi:hypothetical protein